MKLKRIYLTYKISRCNFNKDTAGFVPIFWRLFPFWFIPLVVLRWESSEILGQVNPYFYQHLPDNLSGEEEPTPSMENNLCPPLCLKVKAELKDKKKTQCQLFIRQAGPIFRHSLWTKLILATHYSALLKEPDRPNGGPVFTLLSNLLHLLTVLDCLTVPPSHGPISQQSFFFLRY